ncbi:related to methyltransferase [Rhynchosporium agropyri]|uniref:Related to methyltransferase n=1 Tax=Rhynchosporium agropyri TaxID=914238 RepID=A0A1E1KRC9_9HELO|nr:related to methyltransferase [Rhynchosporium agropyri]
MGAFALAWWFKDWGIYSLTIAPRRTISYPPSKISLHYAEHFTSAKTSRPQFCPLRLKTELTSPSRMPLPVRPEHQTNHPPPPDYIEYGRSYSGFRKGKYMFPIDDNEMDRMDIYHKFFSVARREALHSTPFIENYDKGPRVLDLGCGTGIWAIDMAEKYHHRNVEVKGIDLAVIQPARIPPGLVFSQRDIESPWWWCEVDSWDLIHMRMLAGSISSWQDTYTQIFRHLKPQFGWLEHVEIDMEPRCDDGTLPADSSIIQWTKLLFDATAQAYRPLQYNHRTGAMLQEIGFVDINEQIIKVPLNPWENDPQLKDIGRWYNLGLTQGLDALTTAPLTRMFGWSKVDVDRLVANVKREICSKKLHVYCNMHIWIARRPADA